jgi:hypothetical protein
MAALMKGIPILIWDQVNGGFLGLEEDFSKL